MVKLLDNILLIIIFVGFPAGLIWIFQPVITFQNETEQNK